MKASDWIKVTDRLPEEGTPNVIVLKKRHTAYLGIYDYEGFHINGKIIPNDDILCYMTLVPPNEEQEMKECYKPKASDEIQKASEEYLWRANIDNASVQDHFIAGAEWMKEKMIVVVILKHTTMTWLVMRMNFSRTQRLLIGVIKTISIAEDLLIRDLLLMQQD